MMWTLVQSPPAPAAVHMETDRTFLEKLQPHSNPIVHHYDWAAPAITYGYFIDPHAFLCPNALQRHQVDIARRPTGGGVVFHMTDLAFSVIIPSNFPRYSTNTLDNYSWINQALLKAIQLFLHSSATPQLLLAETTPASPHSQRFCMAHPTRYDVMLNGRKVGGAAQRRIKTGFLHQGTLCLSLPNENLLRELMVSHPDVITAMQNASYPLLGHNPSPQQLATARSELRQNIFNCLKEIH